MFDLIHGLPVHVLVVHLVVVLLPLLSIVTVVFVVRPRWRPELPWAVLGNALILAASFVAKISGENLQDRLSSQVGHEVARWHSQLGAVLPYFALAQLVASVVAFFLLRRRADDTTAVARPALALAIVLTLAAGVAATVWTYRVGDSGAQAVWKDTIASTTKP